MNTVVLGAGVIGVTTAYYLAREGYQVTVIDRQDGAAKETSNANAGLITPGHCYSWASPQAPSMLLRSLFTKSLGLRLRPRLDMAMARWSWRFLLNCREKNWRANTDCAMRLSMYSQRKLHELVDETGIDYEQVRKGVLCLYRDQMSFDRGVASAEIMREAGQHIDVLDRKAIVSLDPALLQLENQLAGALYCPNDESGDAYIFTQKLAEKCAAMGVNFRYGEDIVGLIAEGDRVTAVRTSRGHMPAGNIIVALGSYAPGVVRTIGYHLPIYPVKGYSVTFPLDSHHQAPSIAGIDEHQFMAWARFGNRLRFTATAEFAGYDTSWKEADFARLISAAKAVFPKGADYARPSYWVGLRPMTPGGLPILGQTRHRNMFFNCGHGAMGWTMACGTSRVVADIICGRRPEWTLLA